MNDGERQHLQDYSDLRKYRHEMPNMADDDLNLYEYRLYGHYKRVCGAADGGACFEGTRKTAEKTDMSHPMVIKTRRSLEEKGYIKCEYEPGQTVRVTLVDIWPINMARYSKDAEGVVTQFTPPGHTVYTKNTTTGGGALDAPAEEKSVVRVWEEETRTPITPLVADELHDLVDTYGYGWVVDAIREAVTTLGPGRFNVKYIARILDRWQREGKGPGEKPQSIPDDVPPEHRRQWKVLT